MTSTKNDQLCDSLPTLFIWKKWAIDLLFKNNRIRKHVTNFKTLSTLLPSGRHKCMIPKKEMSPLVNTTYNRQLYNCTTIQPSTHVDHNRVKKLTIFYKIYSTSISSISLFRQINLNFSFFKLFSIPIQHCPMTEGCKFYSTIMLSQDLFDLLTI